MYYQPTQDLITHRTSEVDRHIAELLTRLTETNNDIIAHERATTAQALTTLHSELTLKQEALTAHDAAKPADVPPPTTPASTPAPDPAIAKPPATQDNADQEREQLRLARLTHTTATNPET